MKNMPLPTKEGVIKDMINNPNSYAAIYARQSNPQSNSIPAQVSICKDMAIKNDLLIYKIYEEKKGATEEYSKNRPEFMKLLEDAKLGLFKTLIVFKRDRLCRVMKDFIEVKNLLSKLGVRILYSNQGEFQSDGSYMSDFIENIIMAVSVYEPENISSRTSAGKKKQREKGVYSPGNNLPYGIIKVSDHARVKDGGYDTNVKTYYEIDKICSHKIKTIFDAFNSKNVKNKSDIDTEIPNSSNLNLSKIISNPIYAGLQTKSLDLKYNSFRLEDGDGELLEICEKYFHNVTNVNYKSKFPITPKSWYKAVNKWIRLQYGHKSIGKPKGAPKKRNYLLKGMAYCSNCDHKVYLSGKKYSCGTPNCISIDKVTLDKAVLKELLSYIFQGNYIDDALKNKVESLNITKKAIAEKLANNTSNQKDLIDKYIKDSKDLELKKSIIENVDSETKLKSELTTIICNIEFFSKKLNKYVLSQKETNELVNSLIPTEEKLVQEFLKYNYKKVIISGHNEKKLNIKFEK